MKEHLKEFWARWIALVSGVLSVVLSCFVALPGTSPDVLPFWLVSQAGLFFAGILCLWELQSRIRVLNPEGLTIMRIQQARHMLACMSEAERDGLRELLRMQSMTGEQVRSRLPGVDFVTIRSRTPFLTLEKGLRDIGHETDVWRVGKEWEQILAGQLFGGQWSFLSRWWRRWRYLVRSVLCESRGDRQRARLRV